MPARRQNARNSASRKLLEGLEHRLLFATFSVTSNGDGGTGTLRQAILDANGSPGADTITFAIGSGLQTITPTSAFPTISDPVLIDGTSQPGYTGAPLIELNGSSAGSGVTGLVITAGNSTLRGLTINRFRFDGVQLSASGGNTIVGCYIGTNNTASGASANLGVGIYVLDSGNNTIGAATFTGASGGTFNGRNIISGNNADGIFMESTGAPISGNAIRNNYVGTNLGGTGPIGNHNSGIVVGNNATNTIIGGTNAADRNVVGGNSQDGIQLIGGGISGTLIQGNFVGTRSTGTNTIANGNNGIDLDGQSGSITNNTVGGTAAGARNVVSGNTGDGVQLAGSGASGNFVQGNYIGLDSAGTSSVSNGNDGVNVINAPNNTIGGTSAAARNVISGNMFNGVELQNTGSTGNVVQGNYIGLNAAGTAAVGNRDDGLDINSASNNTIGGTVAGAANVFSGNSSDGVEIAADGSRFPGNAANNLVQGNFIGTNTTGTAAIANGSSGVHIVDNAGTTSATNNTVGGTTAAERNIISGNLGNGVTIEGLRANGNFVRGNYIGTNAAGTAAIGNGTPGLTPSGVGVKVLSANNTIGGTAAGSGNVISGNVTHGMTISSSGTVVQGNLIGLRADGLAALGNGSKGVNLLSDLTGTSANNTIGGPTAGARNVISGNVADGIETSGPSTSGNIIRGNFIGTNISGTGGVQNGGAGISLAQGANTTVGGTGAGEANVIALNNKAGVVVGTATTSSTGNLIRGNSIFGNGAMGIDLFPLGATANDSGDSDTGPNELQNFPVLSSATPGAGNTTVVGTLNSTPGASFTVDFYSSNAADPSGFGQGRTYLGSTVVTTDGAGNASFNVTLSVAVPVGQVIAATATNSINDTSEFSQSIPVTDQATRLTINGDAGGTPTDDVIRLLRSGADLQVFVNSSTPTETVNFASLSGITINGLDGNDAVILDYSGGEVIPAGADAFIYSGGVGADHLRFDGSGSGDAFNVTGGGFAHGAVAGTFDTTEVLDLHIGQFTFTADANGLSLNVDGSATFDVSQHLNGLTIGATGRAVVAPGGAKLIDTQALTLDTSAGSTATLDMNDNDLVVRHAGASGLTNIMQAISRARNGGAWNGASGITSTAAQNAANHNRTLGAMLGGDYVTVHGNNVFDGTTVEPDAAVVKFTYYGDTDFNGRVNFDDYVRTDNGFNNHFSGWINGDFDGNNVVNFDDYVLIDLAFNTQT
jgi:hypothetical protein